MISDPSVEILRLRATVRDLLALSTIPETWVGREPPAIAADLADLLIGSLELDFAFVRLCDPAGGQVAEVTRGNFWTAFPEWLQQHVAEVGQISRKEILSNIGSVEKSCRGIVIPIGVNSERGLVAAASNRSDFPNQVDQQLLSVAANNAATAFQNAFLIKALRTTQEALLANEQALRKARDELENKVAERTTELRRSETELRDVIDSIPAVVWSAMPDGANTYVNKRFVEYSGASAQQTAGSGWEALIHPDDLEQHVGKWMEALASGKPYENEVRSRRSDGQYRWQLDHGVPLRDEDGNILKWYGVTTDIEDRKRAEEAREQNEFYLSQGQRLAHMGSWAFNTGGFEYWSPELFRIHGLDPTGNPPTKEEYLALVHTEDREFVEQWIQDMLASHQAFDFTKRIVRPDGQIRSVRCVGVPATHTGTSRVFVGTGMDVTEQVQAVEEMRKSEEELRQILDFAPQLVGVFGPNHERLHVNRIALDYLGLSLEEWRTHERSSSVHPDDRARDRDYFDRALSTGSAYELELRLRKSDGSYRWFLARFNPVRDANGNIRRWYVANTDIDDRKRAEERLKRRKCGAPRRNRQGFDVRGDRWNISRFASGTLAHLQSCANRFYNSHYR